MRERYYLIDSLRGIAMISMVAYHAVYDLVYLYGRRIPWYLDSRGYLWQQSICWSFIVIAGFSWSFGKNHWRRGLITLGCGAVITLATLLIMPEERIFCGILTFMGMAGLLMIPVEKMLKKTGAVHGLLLCLALFFLTRNINTGYLGFESVRFWKLPPNLYSGAFTLLGFPAPDFVSSDYFSLFPWFFLYLGGYFISRMLMGWETSRRFLKKKIPPFHLVGRKSILIYMLHQPAILLVLELGEFLRKLSF